MNAAANLEEADDGSSRRDFRAKDRIALRELKETVFGYGFCVGRPNS